VGWLGKDSEKPVSALEPCGAVPQLLQPQPPSSQQLQCVSRYAEPAAGIGPDIEGGRAWWQSPDTMIVPGLWSGPDVAAA
jgi:hypothetical protein